MTLAHTPRRAALVLALASGLVVAASGCGGTEDSKAPEQAGPAAAPAAAAAPTIDSCALLTRAEVEAALGKPVGEPVRGDVAPVYSCSFATAEKIESVSVNATVYDSAQQAQDAYAMAIRINSYEEFTGLGERAYVSPIFDVTVLKGRYELSVDVTSSGEKDADIQKAKELAGFALARLPQ
jgi:hypothetical protein